MRQSKKQIEIARREAESAARRARLAAMSDEELAAEVAQAKAFMPELFNPKY